jgi:hypothetical protein
MELTKDDKDELRELIQSEILKAFNAAFSAALNAPTQLGDINNNEKQEAMKNQKAVIREFGNAIKASLQTLEAEAQAKVVEKTDPERAKRIRALAVPTF